MWLNTAAYYDSNYEIIKWIPHVLYIPYRYILWGTVAHWLEQWTHDHKVEGTSPDSSSLCWVPEQDS